jgi:hypothetical protein
MQGGPQKLFLAWIDLVERFLADAKVGRDLVQRDLAKSPGKELVASML